MPLPSSSIVEAMAQSTRRYLDALERSKGGAKTHDLSSISPATKPRTAIDNELWHCFSSTVSGRPKLSQDVLYCLRVLGVEQEMRILKYDRAGGGLLFAVRSPVSHDAGQIVIDFRWLVRRVLIWLENRGSTVCNPANLPSPVVTTKVEFRADTSDEKRSLIVDLLNSRLFYVWGPPGTGKSSHVLATAVAHCVSRGDKILVLAPTNLSVDNALEAVLKSLPDTSKLLRLGTPTQEFFEKHPECCEARLFQRMADEARDRIIELEESIKRLNDQIEFMRRKRAITLRLSQIQEDLRSWEPLRDRYQNEMGDLARKLREVDESLAVGREMLADLGQRLAQLNIETICKQLQSVEADHISIIQSIHELTRREAKLTWLDALTSKPRRIQAEKDALLSRRKVVEATLQNLRSRNTEIQSQAKPLLDQCAQIETVMRSKSDERDQIAAAIETRKVSAAALQIRIDSHGDEERKSNQWLLEREATFGVWLVEADLLRQIGDSQIQIARQNQIVSAFHQDLSSKSVLGMTLDSFVGMTLTKGTITVSRVFVDEASYAPLAKIIPLLSLHCPIALLGDHLQLPPVCENESNPIIRSYWAKRAIFLEDAFELGDDHLALYHSATPRHQQMPRGVLKHSYRFGARMAELLDNLVYEKIGLTGLGEADTKIEVVNCNPYIVPNQLKRQNHSEVDAIVLQVRRWMAWTNVSNETLAILTPYTNQVKLLQRAIEKIPGAMEKIEVMNIHQSQGREWDWVLFSAVDTRQLPLNFPWFTDCSNPRSEGRAVLNTAVSRTRKYLKVYLDERFWKRWNERGFLAQMIQRFYLGGE